MIEGDESYPTVVSAAKLEISVAIQPLDPAGLIVRFWLISRRIAKYPEAENTRYG